MHNDHAVLFLYPRRPVLDSINQIGLNWIYISWNRNNAADNVTEYEVEYFYAGECSEINNDIITETVGGSNSSYNITGLGEYLNYSIALIAINDTRTGRSPPNIKFAVTLPTSMYFNLSTTSYPLKFLFFLQHQLSLHRHLWLLWNFQQTLQCGGKELDAVKEGVRLHAIFYNIHLKIVIGSQKRVYQEPVIVTECTQLTDYSSCLPTHLPLQLSTELDREDQTQQSAQ